MSDTTATARKPECCGRWVADRCIYMVQPDEDRYCAGCPVWVEVSPRRAADLEREMDAGYDEGKWWE